MKETKQKVVESAYKIVAAVGLENTTTKKIAKAASFSESIMYQHFSGKDDMLEFAFLQLNSDIDKLIMLELSSFSDGYTKTERYEIMWRAYLNFFLKNPIKATFYDKYYHSSYKITHTNMFEKFVLENSNIQILNAIISLTLSVTLDRDEDSKPVSSDVITKLFSAVKILLNV